MIELGSEVKDIVTGFKGIAVGITTYLRGCNRILVQPKLDKEGNLVEAQSFDEPDVKVIGNGLLPEPKKKKPLGGPRPIATRAKAPERRRGGR